MIIYYRFMLKVHYVTIGPLAVKNEIACILQKNIVLVVLA